MPFYKAVFEELIGQRNDEVVVSIDLKSLFLSRQFQKNFTKKVKTSQFIAICCSLKQVTILNSRNFFTAEGSFDLFERLFTKSCNAQD